MTPNLCLRRFSKHRKHRHSHTSHRNLFQPNRQSSHMLLPHRPSSACLSHRRLRRTPSRRLWHSLKLMLHPRFHQSRPSQLFVNIIFKMLSFTVLGCVEARGPEPDRARQPPWLERSSASIQHPSAQEACTSKSALPAPECLFDWAVLAC